MHTKLTASVVVLSSVFFVSAPVLAAGADTGQATNQTANNATASQMGGTEGKTVGTAEVQHIQQMLNDAETTRNANAADGESGNAGAGNGNSAALYQAPYASNPGTLAESAKTTALSTSTYHQ